MVGNIFAAFLQHCAQTRKNKMKELHGSFQGLICYLQLTSIHPFAKQAIIALNAVHLIPTILNHYWTPSALLVPVGIRG